ncbi:MAG: hypothetical protein Q4B50_02940 [Bacillota bacterium]|nr:hypothetical protein [Bacillota bacterium]
MNRRAFSRAPGQGGGSLVYAVRLWSLTGSCDYDYGDFDAGLYGYFSPGTTVIVDLSADDVVVQIENVAPYILSSELIEWQERGQNMVSFTMPEFDVAVELETIY